MSMIECERCDAPIDSDDDPACFCETLNSEGVVLQVLCENCREKLEIDDV